MVPLERIVTAWRERVFVPAAGVVDQDRHRTENRVGLGEYLRRRIGIGKVGLDGVDPSPGCFDCGDSCLGALLALRAVFRRSTGIVVGGGVREVGDGDVGTEPGDLSCGGSADSVVGAGDDGQAARRAEGGTRRENLSTNGWDSRFVSGLTRRRSTTAPFGSST